MLGKRFGSTIIVAHVREPHGHDADGLAMLDRAARGGAAALKGGDRAYQRGGRRLATSPRLRTRCSSGRRG